MKRMRLLKRVSDDRERRHAQKLAASERQLGEQERKLNELRSYHAEYAREFTHRATNGIGGVGLIDFQTFLSRLAEAVRQQVDIVARLRTERDAEMRAWQGAAQRSEIVGHVVKRREVTQRKEIDQQEQRESDERAQRTSTRSPHVNDS